MTIDDSGMESAELAERRERVVGAVVSRIGAAPPPQLASPSLIVAVAAWTIPALTAASIIIAVSASVLIASRPSNAPPTIVDVLGVPAAIAQFVNTGKVDGWAWESRR
jgi:hypothetical protein